MEQENLLMYSINKFFSTPENLNKMWSVISKKSPVSLRLLEWFVTNYSKKYKTLLRFENGETLSVHSNYKSQLKSFSKKQFDPFCRGERIKYYHSENKYLETTIGQLSFFKWAIEKGILKYAEENKNSIEKDMVKSLKENENKLETKRKPLSSSSKYHKNVEKFVVEFD